MAVRGSSVTYGTTNGDISNLSFQTVDKLGPFAVEELDSGSVGSLGSQNRD